MKAAYFTKYGSVDQLTVRDVPKPQPAENEVLIRNHASSINFGNVGHVKGEPFFIRTFTGFGKPKFNIPGGDVAGVVEAVGSKVSEFKAGDEVMADGADSGFGAFAEYVTVADKVVVHKPSGLSFNETATLLLAACTAFYGLKDKGRLQTGQKVLLIGSTGSVGSFAVQIAKAFGAEVTAVCSGIHTKYVQNLGADHVIDYRKEDFTKQNKQYDLVVGIAGTRTMIDYKSVLKPTGTYVNIGGSMKQFRNAFTTGPLLFVFSKQKFILLMYKANKKVLMSVKEQVEAGKLKPVIEKTFSLNQVVEAYKYYESAHPAGKIVITIQ
jgi:2-desacetyl-2-hydroxyethyl bacteriochlorophyllide A dehydrogenase